MKMSRSIAAGWAATLAITCLFGQDPTPKRVAIKAARLYDGKHDKPLEHAVVLVEGDRIKSVGANLPVPEGAEVIDLGDATLLPGLIDAHTHLMMELEPIEDFPKAIQAFVQDHNTAQRVLFGASTAKEMLEAGFTTVRDLGNSGIGGDVILRDAIQMGWVPGPRIQASTRAISALGGQFPRMRKDAQGIVADEYVEVAGPVEARKAVRQAVADGADVIKVIIDQPVRGSLHALDFEEVSAIVAEAHRLKKKVAAHVWRAESVDIAIQAGVDSIEHGYRLTDSQLKAMAQAQKRIVLVPTDGTVEGAKPFYPSPTEWKKVEAVVMEDQAANADRLRRAKAAGIRIVAGSDMTIHIPGRTRGEASKDMFGAYAAAGMTPLEILRAATSDSAELLGWGDRVGSLEPGRFADLIAIPKAFGAIGDLDHVKFVMKGGAVVVRKVQ